MISPKLILLLAAASLTLGACAGTGAPIAGVVDPVTPTERFPIEVKPEPREVRLATHSAGVSANQAEALAAFARTWADEEGADVTVQSPARGGDPTAAYRTATGARDVLVAEGVPAHRIRIIGYDGAGDAAAPVIVGYTRYQARGPDCGRAWGDLANTNDNREYDNFGCSITANMAAQIANPGDLLAPRGSEPADAGRRQNVLDHYRKGEVTSSAKDEQASGAVSRAVP